MTNKQLWEPVLKISHNTFWQQAYKRVKAKIRTLNSNLKVRSEKVDVLYDITSKELEALFLEAYNAPCKYCSTKLTYRNMACDHIVPLVKGGESIKDNLQLICKSCNTRKGPLDEKEFIQLLDWVNTQTMELKTYLMKKLAKGGKW